VSKTDPAVVDVVSTLGNQNGTAAGTGIVLTSSGEVLTNNHVIDGATSIKVRDVGNGQVYTASVVGYDVTQDVALIQLRGASGLQTADLGNSSSVTVGEKVVAIGNAGGQNGTPSVATGQVTGLDQSITASDASAGTAEQLTGLIRTNAGIQAGDSGGPLLNSSGQVIGIDTAASSGTFQLNSSTATQAFTIPINEALSIARQIEAGTSSATVHIGSTAFLGVEIVSASQQLGNSAAGAAVAGIQPGSAAAGAGLSAGDVITAVGGHSISTASDVRSALNGYHPGDRISITWTDQTGQSQSATIVLGSGPAA
jgi:S1-C subfamily serine protease